MPLNFFLMIEINWPRTETSGELLWTRQWNVNYQAWSNALPKNYIFLYKIASLLSLDWL